MRALALLLSFMFSPIASAQLGPWSNAWNSDRQSRFTHVIDAAPGKLTLTLKATTTAAGGETVAVYFADAKGNRKTGWRLYVIATRAGNGDSKSFVVPKPRENQKTTRVPLVVVVENASGKSHSGDYTLTASR